MIENKRRSSIWPVHQVKRFFFILYLSNSTFVFNLYNSHLGWNTRAHSFFRETHRWQDKIESRSSIRTMPMSVCVCVFCISSLSNKKSSFILLTFFVFFFSLSLAALSSSSCSLVLNHHSPIHVRSRLSQRTTKRI